MEDYFDLIELVELRRWREREVEGFRNRSAPLRNGSYRLSPKTLLGGLRQIPIDQNQLQRNGLRRRVGVENRHLQPATATQTDGLLQLLSGFHLHGEVI